MCSLNSRVGSDATGNELVDCISFSNLIFAPTTRPRNAYMTYIRHRANLPVASTLTFDLRLRITFLPSFSTLFVKSTFNDYMGVNVIGRKDVSNTIYKVIFIILIYFNSIETMDIYFPFYPRPRGGGKICRYLDSEEKTNGKGKKGRRKETKKREKEKNKEKR